MCGHDPADARRVPRWPSLYIYGVSIIYPMPPVITLDPDF
jgi:hypothetical protein